MNLIEKNEFSSNAFFVCPVPLARVHTEHKLVIPLNTF